MVTMLEIQQQQFKRKIKMVWIALTLIFTTSFLYYSWQYTHWQTNQNFQRKANSFSFRMDDFIEKILIQTANFPFRDKRFKHCDDFLKPLLGTYVFNHTKIAGIAIKDKQSDFFCSTIDNNPIINSSLYTKPLLLGPIAAGQSNNVFMLQQSLDHYDLGLYFTKSALNEFIKKNNDAFSFIALYDKKLKKIIFYTGISEVTYCSWFVFKTDNSLFNAAGSSKSNDNILTLPLHSLDNIELIIHSKPINTRSYIMVNLLSLLPFILLLWIGYRYLLVLVSDRYSLFYALKKALVKKEFFPIYQPIYDNKKNICKGAEVLIRWRSSINEIIMPDDFIEEAEKSGLIVPITLNLVNQTLTECQRLLHQNPEFHLAFNLSLAHFKDADFFEKFFQLFQDYHISANQIMLEMTEREIFDQTQLNIVDRLKDLRQRGYALALDDFGTGYASISYLQYFPFNYLKIDKLFIHAIGTGAITEVLNLAIINMANSLHLQVIAEGVETQEQFNYLLEHDVELVQGWYISKAIDHQALEAFILI